MRAPWLPALVLLAGAGTASALEPAVPWHPESGAIIGRVFVDRDGDGAWSQGDEGLPGVVLHTDTGEAAVTDGQGRYHLMPLASGNEVLSSHVVKIALDSLPAGLVPARSARRLVHLSPMQAARVDFPVARQSDTVEEGRGLGPAGDGVTPLLSPRGEGFVMTSLLAGRAGAGCTVQVDGRPVDVDPDGTFQARVEVSPGANAYLITTQCPDGQLEMLLAGIHWVRREQGGDLIVPAEPRTLATCAAPPPGEVPLRPSLEIACRVAPGVELEAAGESHAGTAGGGVNRLRIPVEPGPNRVELRLSAGEARGLVAAAAWHVGRVRWTGALLGTLGFSYGDAGAVFGGKLRGHLRAHLPEDFKLVLGGGLETSDENDFLDFIVPAYHPLRHQRAPDPEEIGPVAGDEGLVADDNPSDARYLLRVERKSSSIGWGGFSTGAGRELETGSYRRALFGAHGVLHPFEDLFDQERPVLDLALEGFWAPADPASDTVGSFRTPLTADVRRAPAHEEFLDTGGTLYFLGRSWVVAGSERVEIQRRDRRTGLTLERRALGRDVDYQVDWTSGRLMLTEPPDPGLMGAQAVRLLPGGETVTVLVVDYEYVQTEAPGTGPDATGARAELTARPGRGTVLSAAYTTVAEAGGGDFRLHQGSARARFGRWGSLWAGYASSEGRVLVPAYSVDGGISLAQAPLPQRAAGEAIEAGARLDLERIQGLVMFRRWLAGYADTSVLASQDLTQGLALISARPHSSLRVTGRFSATRWGAGNGMTPGEMPAEEGRYLEGRLGARVAVLDELHLQAAGAFDLGDGGALGDGHRAVAGLRGTYRVTDWLALTAGHQHTLVRSGAGPASRDVTLSSAGTQWTFADRYHLGLEGGWGRDLGNLVRLWLREDQPGGGAVFAHTTFAVDGDGPGAGVLTAGQTAPAAGGVMVSASHTLAAERLWTSRGQQLGVTVPLGDPWRLRLAFTRTELEQPADAGVRADRVPGPFHDRGLWRLDGPGRRNTLAARLAHVTRRLALSAGGELRVDEHLRPAHDALAGGPLLDDPAHTLRQALLSLAGRWRATDGLVVGGRLAWAETFALSAGSDPFDPDVTGRDQGRFLEGLVGLAWRPEQPGWIRLLTRLAAGGGTRPAGLGEDRGGWDPQRWLTGSLALLLSPSRYFQPTLVVAPWLVTYRHEDAGDTLAPDLRPRATALVGMLRIGSRLVAGLGLAGEMRWMGAGTRDIEVRPGLPVDGWEAGAAVELFYLLEHPGAGAVRLGVGYSFSDIPDPLLLSDLHTGRRGLFVRLEGMM